MKKQFCEKCMSEIGSTSHECDPLNVAGVWLSSYLLKNDEGESPSGASTTCECESDEVWNARCEFVSKCLIAGFEPIEYAELIIEGQREFNRYALLPVLAVIAIGPPGSGKTQFLMHDIGCQYIADAEAIESDSANAKAIYAAAQSNSWDYIGIETMNRDPSKLIEALDAEGFLVAVKFMQPRTRS